MGPVALHTYPLTGTYAVVLTASNPCGSASVSATVEVAYCHAPVGLEIVHAPHPLLAGLPEDMDPGSYLQQFVAVVTTPGVTKGGLLEALAQLEARIARG